MGETATLDHALRGVVVDRQSFDLGEELVAIAKSLAGAAALNRQLALALDAVLTVRMRAGPFGGRPIVLALNPQLECIGPAERGQDVGPAKRIIARRHDVACAKRIGLVFLIARETQRPQLRASRK